MWVDRSGYGGHEKWHSLFINKNIKSPEIVYMVKRGIKNKVKRSCQKQSKSNKKRPREKQLCRYSSKDILTKGSLGWGSGSACRRSTNPARCGCGECPPAQGTPSPEAAAPIAQPGRPLGSPGWTGTRPGRHRGSAVASQGEMAPSSHRTPPTVGAVRPAGGPERHWWPQETPAAGACESLAIASPRGRVSSLERWCWMLLCLCRLWSIFRLRLLWGAQRWGLTSECGGQQRSERRAASSRCPAKLPV